MTDNVHASEEYKCTNCNKTLDRNEITPDWRCKICNELVSIKVETADGEHSCHRMHPEDIRTDGMGLVLVNRQLMFPLLGLSPFQGKFKLGLKGYGNIIKAPDEFCLVVNGTWHD